MSAEQKRIEFLACEEIRAALTTRYVAAKAESDRLHDLLIVAAETSYRAEQALIATSLEEG